MPLHPGVDEVRAGGRAASTASPFHRSNFIRPAGAREVKSNNYARDCLLIYLIALFAPPRRAALAEGRVGLPPPPKFTSLRPRRGGSQIVGKFDRAILLALIDRIVWAINVKPPLLSHRWPGRLTHPSWYKGDLHELMCLGSGHASLLCVSWQARRVPIARSRLKDRSTNI